MSKVGRIKPSDQAAVTNELEILPLLISDDKKFPRDTAVATIIVPAARAHHNLAFAIGLAKESGASLVVLASHETIPEAAAAAIARAGVHGFVACLPDDYILPLYIAVDRRFRH